MKHRWSIGIIFVIGCATGGVAAQLVVPPVRAGTAPTRWEYLCLNIAAGELTAQTNKLGAEGWELVSFVPTHQSREIGSDFTSDAFTFCTKRALP